MSENTMTDPMQDLGTLLLTGIPNDITLWEIVPNLPWRTGHLLRAVSNDWQRSFQSGMVYDARVRSQATEKFLLAVCALNPRRLDLLRNNDEAEDLSSSEDDDLSDDEAEIRSIGEAKDPPVSKDDLDDTLDDVTWIKMIDPDLFRDDVSGDSQWFREDIKNGLYKFIEGHGLPYFNKVMENGGLWRFEDMTDVNCYIVYDTGEDKWRVVGNLSTHDLDAIRLLARPFQTPYNFVSRNRRRPFDLVEAELWPLNL